MAQLESTAATSFFSIGAAHDRADEHHPFDELWMRESEIDCEFAAVRAADQESAIDFQVAE